jgi:3-methyladenine DNA glycosylase AlkD
MYTRETILSEIQNNGNSSTLSGKKRFGIVPLNGYGCTMPFIRDLAKKIRKNHLLAFDLWNSKIHEARILAVLIADPKLISSPELDLWCSELYSWDVCDQFCMNLVRKTPFAYDKIAQWAENEHEFIRRAGYVTLATLAVHDKKADDAVFCQYFDILEKGSRDERNFVRKAVNWAIRQIGKRNNSLRVKSIEFCRNIKSQNNPTSNWIANDALRELTDVKIINRLTTS